MANGSSFLDVLTAWFITCIFVTTLLRNRLRAVAATADRQLVTLGSADLRGSYSNAVQRAVPDFARETLPGARPGPGRTASPATEKRGAAAQRGMAANCISG